MLEGTPENPSVATTPLSELMAQMAERLMLARQNSAGMLRDPGAESSGYRVLDSGVESGRRIVGLDFCDQVAVWVWHNLAQLESQYREGGRSLEELGSAEELAGRMAATVPTPSPWNEALGPFYGPGKVARILGGVTRQAVADRRGRGTLLGLKTADGKWVYPSFQFDANHRVHPGLPEVIRCLRDTDLDEWTLASWLVAPREGLGGESVVGWLAAGRDPAAPLNLARETAERLAQ